MIELLVPYDVEKDAQSIHEALQRFGAISMRFPATLPGFLLIVFHDQTDGDGIQLAGDAAVAAAPAPIRRESRETTLRRALVKAARGKALSGAETGALDRAEVE